MNTEIEKAIKNLYLGSFLPSSDIREEKSLLPSALDIAAEQMRLSPQFSSVDLEKRATVEEETVFAQVPHFINTIIAMKIPLDASVRAQSYSTVKAHKHYSESDTNSISNITNSNHYEPDTVSNGSNKDDESGFEEEKLHNFGTSEIATNVIKFVSRFVDKVCTDSSIGEERIRRLHEIIPSSVAMQIESNEAVLRESKRLPPISKPKIITPNLLDGEELMTTGLRVYLLPDGRDDPQPVGVILMPAEGAIFLTNYRIVFKGRPCDPFASESLVVRSLPIASMTKEKRFSIQASSNLSSIEQFLHEG